MTSVNASHPPFSLFPSRRSVVHSRHGIVSCTQPLAAQAGLRVLRAGGNAADAAVAVAAALGVTEPTSTGIGGDLFCLFFSAADKKVRGLNASGRSPAALTLDLARKRLGPDALRIPFSSPLSPTVPGAAAGWCDVVSYFGSHKLGLGEILKDAIELAEDGFPVSELSALFWDDCKDALVGENRGEMLKDGGRAPGTGEIMKLPGLAKTIRKLAKEGKGGFYEGEVAEAIVKAVKAAGGVMELEDLKEHTDIGSEIVEPVGIEWEGFKVWECPPNGQGIVALMTLGILEDLEKQGKIERLGTDKEGWGHNETEYLHAIIESLRIAFSDGHWFVADPSVSPVPVPSLLSRQYLHQRAELFSPAHRNPSLSPGSPAQNSSDTVYFSVVDAAGNGCSFINSTLSGFGCGIIPKSFGFNLHSRGTGFSLDPSHPNALAPKKRPYHTIIPGLLTDPEGKELKAVFGVMGGFMQPQGHVQVLLNLVKNRFNPQQALDASRVSIGVNYDPEVDMVHLEEGISENAVAGLKDKGHKVKVVTGHERGMFGRGQIIWVNETDEGRVYSAGSDMRGDGHAVGY